MSVDIIIETYIFLFPYPLSTKNVVLATITAGTP